jgi:hypothetical protein
MTALFGWKLFERFRGCQYFGFKQTPQGKIGIILPHVGCGCKEEQVMGMPGQMPAVLTILRTG